MQWPRLHPLVLLREIERLRDELCVALIGIDLIKGFGFLSVVEPFGQEHAVTYGIAK